MLVLIRSMPRRVLHGGRPGSNSVGFAVLGMIFKATTYGIMLLQDLKTSLAVKLKDLDSSLQSPLGIQ
jgi:hypothetical protein